MERQEELIKKYIKKNISLKVISLEFGVPLELVEKYQKELLIEERKQKAVKPLRATNQDSYLKMKEMRDKYQKLVSGEKKRTRVTSILADVKELKLYQPLPLKVAERFQKMIDSLNANGMPFKDTNLNRAIYEAKIGAADSVANAIKIIAEEATSIEDLQAAYRMLTPELEKKNKIAVSSLKNMIQKRISELQLKNAMERIKNIPQNLSDMIQRLLNGEIDSQEANRIIEEEAKKRVAARPQSKFPITEEQEKRQISIQIRTAIMENPDKYNIKNPEAAIGDICVLCGGQQGEAIRTVVTNLIGKNILKLPKEYAENFRKKIKWNTYSLY